MFGLSLCAGAGGLDLALRLVTNGYRTVGYVEREAFAAAILVARMEDAALDRAPVWDDIVTFDGRRWRGCVDILATGYPCQPFSVAGQRRGADDPRHLWPQVARIVGECEPPFVFLENVAHHLRLGFPEVARDLVGMGYRIAAGLFTAAEVGAPHRRERLFALACRDGDAMADPARLLGGAFERRQSDGAVASVADAEGMRRDEAERGQAAQRRSDATVAAVEHTICCGRGGRTDGEERRAIERIAAQGSSFDAHGNLGHTDGARSPSGSWDPRVDLCEPGDASAQQPAALGTGGDFPFPPGPADAGGWATFLERHPHLEPAVRRGADGLAFRVDRLRLYGNGVVPLAAAHALRTLAAELAGDA